MTLEKNIKCILHGSFRQHFDIIKEIHNLFTGAGIKVIAPDSSDIVGQRDGFVQLKTDSSQDPRIIELLYLKKAAELGPAGFSYYINPQGTLGTSTSYELAIDQLTNTRTIFMKPLRDHPAYIPHNSIWKPDELIQYLAEYHHYPPPKIPHDGIAS